MGSADVGHAFDSGTLKVFCEKTFLVKHPPDQKRIITPNGAKPQASQAPVRAYQIKGAGAYIGWRTMAYGPVEMTLIGGHFDRGRRECVFRYTRK